VIIPSLSETFMERTKRIALVAHDNRKHDLIEWVEWNWSSLSEHRLICTGTTGSLVEKALRKKLPRDGRVVPDIRKLRSGPLGGDQQLGALIAEGEVDVIVFLWDPMEPQPHDVDVKALLRIAVLYNVPTACNRSTADFLISSPLFTQPYEPTLVDYSSYLRRRV
jgi:methylglyoxal synthase